MSIEDFAVRPSAFVSGLLLLTDWPSVTVGPDEPVMAIGTDSLELSLGASHGTCVPWSKHVKT